MRSRAAHAAALLPEVRAALAERTALEWEAMFGERVPCAAVRPIEEMFEHPQVAAEELVTTLDHPVVGRYRTMTKPIEVLGDAGAGADGGADVRTAQRRGAVGVWLFGRGDCRRCGSAAW